MQIYRLDVAGRTIAMLIALRGGDTLYTFKIAHDPEFDRFSPGVTAMLGVTRRAIEDPACVLVDSCAAEDHPMINLLWHEKRTLNDWFIPSTWPGRLVAARLLQRRYEAKMKKRG